VKFSIQSTRQMPVESEFFRCTEDDACKHEAKEPASMREVMVSPRVLEHEWNQLLVEKSVVRYDLVAEGDATILTFTHRRLSLSNAKGYVSGTHAFLDRLDAHLNGIDLPDWKQRYAEVQQAYYSDYIK
jgi:hypothetical protein